MISLNSRVALVTGGSRGLGAEIVRHLAGLGADVAFTYLQDKKAAEEVANDVRKIGRRSLCVQADAGDYNRAQQVVDNVRSELSNVHILVTSAAIARGGALWKIGESDWDDVVKVSLKGAFNYIRAMAKSFMDQKYGKIVCVGSINGLRGRIGTISYNVAKAGLVGLVKTVASEMGRFNVNANLVAPGYIETESQENTPELVRDLVLKECAIKRLGTPEDIVPLVGFLCSDAARHITGQTIKIDAGQYL